MDSLDSDKLKRKGKMKVDEDHEREDPNKCQDKREKRPRCDSLQQSISPKNCKLTCPVLMPVLPVPKLEEWCLGASIILSGTACKIGPSVGAVDIGVGKSAYYFCLSVPGVKHGTGEFSCKIQRDGKVHVEGVTTTGGTVVSRYSRVFVMKLQQHCPPGPFKLFFMLPGPVDPRSFAADFRPDGIFEGVVAKLQQ